MIPFLCCHLPLTATSQSYLTQSAGHTTDEAQIGGYLNATVTSSRLITYLLSPTAHSNWSISFTTQSAHHTTDKAQIGAYLKAILT